MGPLTKEPPESAKAAQDSAAHSDPPASQGMHTASIDAFGIEIPVHLQGGPTGGAYGATEAYEEDTCTLIVFPQGAVLRSSTNLAPGQHLLLRNQKTNQEVGCRVADLRSYSTGYVEIEFVRPSPGFWGIIFPSETPKPSGARVAPNVALPKQGPAPAPAHAMTPASKAYSPLPRPALSKNVAATSLPTKVSKPASPPAARPLLKEAPAAVPPKTKEQPAAPAAATLAARPLAPIVPLVREQPAKSPSAAPLAPHPAPASAFAAPSSHEQDTQSIADHVAVKPPAEKASAPYGRAAETTAVPRPLGSLEEKEHWATLSYGRFSSFEVLGAEESTGDEFSLGAPSPVQENNPRSKVFFVGISVALILALGTAAFFIPHHFRKAPPAAASLSPAATPALEQPNLVPQPQAAGPNAEPLQAPQQPSPSVNPAGQPGKQTATETKEAAISRPKSEAATVEPAPKPSFRLAPSAAAPQRASVSRETPQPPALGEDVAASPADAAGISNGVMPDALRSDAEIPPPPPAKTTERTGGVVKLPQLLHMVPPSYPLAAKQINLQGEVTVQASVDPTGKVVGAKALSGPVLLQQAAIDAVRHWKYAPAMLDGKPVLMRVVVKVQFRLN